MPCLSRVLLSQWNYRKTMLKLRSALLFFVLVVLSIASILYFLSRSSDKQFLDSIMGNLLATMIGAFVGILSALQINTWQQDTVEQRENEKKILEEKQLLKVVKERLFQEIKDNYERLKTLDKILQESDSARSDLWEWAITVVASFNFISYNDLLNSGLARLLAEEEKDNLYKLYKLLNDLLHSVRQAKAALLFFYGYGEGADRADPKLPEVRNDTTQVLQQIEVTLNTWK